MYDESHTDYLYTRCRIRVNAVINAGVSPATVGEKPNATMTRIRKCLMAPRQQLYFGTAGYDSTQPAASQVQNLLVVAPPNGYTVDANNGPKPVACSITMITLSTFLCTYEIECFLNECSTCGTAGSQLPYLSNRWREIHDIDQEGYVQRTIEGQVIFNSQFVDSKIATPTNPPVDNWRMMIAPPNISQLNGMSRQSAQFQSTEDGLQLKYRIVDKQGYAFLGGGFVTRWEGTRTVSFKAQGGTASERLSVKCWAPPTVPKANLYKVAAATALACFDSNKLIMSGSTSDHLHENYVEVVLQSIGGKTTVVGGKGIVFPFQDFPELATGIQGNKQTDQVAQLPMRGAGINLNMLVLSKYLGMCIASAPLQNAVPYSAAGS